MIKLGEAQGGGKAAKVEEKFMENGIKVYPKNVLMKIGKNKEKIHGSCQKSLMN